MRPNAQPPALAGKEGTSSLTTDRFGDGNLVASCGGFVSSQEYLHYSSSEFRCLRHPWDATRDREAQWLFKSLVAGAPRSSGRATRVLPSPLAGHVIEPLSAGLLNAAAGWYQGDQNEDSGSFFFLPEKEKSKWC